MALFLCLKLTASLSPVLSLLLLFALYKEVEMDKSARGREQPFSLLFVIYTPAPSWCGHNSLVTSAWGWLGAIMSVIYNPPTQFTCFINELNKQA
jgi:hypothetical protein